VIMNPIAKLSLVTFAAGLIAAGLSSMTAPALATLPIEVAQEPAQNEPTQIDSAPAETPSSRAADLDLDPDLIEESPVLERWLEEIPNVLSEIRRDPSFRTRIRLGYSQFPANEQAAGFNVGVEDVFIGRTGLTVSADYQGTFNGEREAYGGNLHYYILPLGSSINVAPLVGYRHIDTDRYTTDGVNLGVRLRVVPSRTGAADITLTQSWVAPGTDEEVGISTLSFGYAITPEIRLSTDLEKQNAAARKDSRVGIGVEWMP
jgi:hypothetical protein